MARKGAKKPVEDESKPLAGTKRKAEVSAEEGKLTRWTFKRLQDLLDSPH